VVPAPCPCRAGSWIITVVLLPEVVPVLVRLVGLATDAGRPLVGSVARAGRPLVWDLQLLLPMLDMPRPEREREARPDIRTRRGELMAGRETQLGMRLVVPIVAAGPGRETPGPGDPTELDGDGLATVGNPGGSWLRYTVRAGPDPICPPDGADPAVPGESGSCQLGETAPGCRPKLVSAAAIPGVVLEREGGSRGSVVEPT